MVKCENLCLNNSITYEVLCERKSLYSLATHSQGIFFLVESPTGDHIQ